MSRPDEHGQIVPLFKPARTAKAKGRKRVKPLSDRKAAADEYYRQQCIEVVIRSEGDCELVTPVCTGRGEQVHHVKMRSQGGTHALDNLRHTCRACHGYAHGNRDEAKAIGWIA